MFSSAKLIQRLTLSTLLPTHCCRSYSTPCQAAPKPASGGCSSTASTAAGKQDLYRGFEQGSSRPPSEAGSLLIRVTRNCQWNQCTFCPTYRDGEFSFRPVEYIVQDIDTVAKYVALILDRSASTLDGQVQMSELVKDVKNQDELYAFGAATHFVNNGLESVFLQDADAFAAPPEDLIKIVTQLRKHFPYIKRITSYARSQSVVKKNPEELLAIRNAGLNRVHIGMESGADDVLRVVKKGSSKRRHVRAGKMVKQAGFELSEYMMPGLGGVALSRVHALESADALNQINPDFIRLRSLAIPRNTELFEDHQKGKFQKLTDIKVAEEILLFIQNLNGITSTITSDHILNLFEEISGPMPESKGKMISVLEKFLSLPRMEQAIYQIGRRLGVFRNLRDLENPRVKDRVISFMAANQISIDNVDRAADDLLLRFS